MATQIKEKKSSSVHLLAGSISGLISCVLLQPLDLRLQQNLHARRNLLLNSSLSNWEKKSLTTINTWSTINDVIRKDGFSGLWRGTLPTIYRNVPGSGLYFYALHMLRENMKRIPGLREGTQLIPQDIIHISAGVIARVSVGYIMMPITVVKVRYESNLYNYKSIFGAFESILKQEGFRGLFSGFGATALRDAPVAGIYVFFYENFKTLLAHEDYGRQSSSMIISMSAGVGGGFAATMLTQPFDMIKTRIQLKPKDYKNSYHALSKVVREEGFRGLFSGMIPRMLRKSFSSAISWTVYEEIIRFTN